MRLFQVIHLFHIWNTFSARNNTGGRNFPMPKLSRKKDTQKPRRARREASYARLVKFPQVKGRTVEKVELSLDSDYHCVSIRFKDKTDLTVVIDPALTFQATYSEWMAGNQKVLKRWPVIQSHGG
jgi:hypothetical protein